MRKLNPCSRMIKTLSGYLQLIPLLFLMQLVACRSTPAKKDQPPPPAPPTTILPIAGPIYGKPKEIRTIITTDRKPTETIATFDWASRKITYLGSVFYLGAGHRVDSSFSIERGLRNHFFKTPYYKEYYSFTQTTEPAEYHFQFELDTVNRQVREVKANPADTSEYSIDYFSADGFLIHRYMKLSKTDYNHRYYANDNHGNPIKTRVVIKGLDYIQEKCEYEYDKEGNWVVKDLYHFYPEGESFKMQWKRTITY